jgi:hypothetical protein
MVYNYTLPDWWLITNVRNHKKISLFGLQANLIDCLIIGDHLLSQLLYGAAGLKPKN